MKRNILSVSIALACAGVAVPSAAQRAPTQFNLMEASHLAK